MINCDIRYHPYEILSHKRIEIGDTNDTDLIKHLSEIVEWIDQERNSGRNVLVHCKAGVSRSASAIIAYLM
jgi:protein-tyrosine phosphatase